MRIYVLRCFISFLATVLIRLCVFPVMVRQRRHLAKYTNVMPQVAVLQESLTRARLSGNYIESKFH